MRSVTRNFPVVYAAGLLGVPRANDTYRWTKLDAGQSAAYEQLASAVRPFPAESLVELAPSGVERTEPGLTAHPSSDTDGFPIWIVAALAAGAGLVGLLSQSRRGKQPEPARPSTIPAERTGRVGQQSLATGAPVSTTSNASPGTSLRSPSASSSQRGLDAPVM